MSNIVKSNTMHNQFEVMGKAMEMSEFMAKSDIIPAHYKGKPSNVFIALQTALRMNIDPLMVMQSTFVVSGKLGMASSFAISLANSSGLFKDGIRYKVSGSGENLAVTAYTNYRSSGEEISYTVSMKMAQAEGWVKNSKYQSMPELMLRYRAATFLIRTHAPEVLNGMHMVEELEDISHSTTYQVQNVSASVSENLISKIEAQLQPPEVTSPTLVEKLLNLITIKEVPDSIVNKWLEKANARSFLEFGDPELQKCIDYIMEKY